jgi:uncharacterized protein (DUF1697 family)
MPAVRGKASARAPAAKTPSKKATIKTTARPASAGAVTVMLAFLRGINVGGNKLVPMAELRALATKLGFGDVATFIQSGNLIFTTTQAPAAVETALQAAIQKRFGFSVDVVARTAEQWQRYAARTPFEDAATERPHLLHLGLAKAAVRAGAGEALAPYLRGGERVHPADDCIWIDYAAGAGQSKVSPAVLDRAIGSTVTARNWRTVQKLAALAAALVAKGAP